MYVVKVSVTWGLKLSWQWILRLWSSGMWCHIFYYEDGWNVESRVPHWMTSHSRRLESWYLLLWKLCVQRLYLHILLWVFVFVCVCVFHGLFSNTFTSSCLGFCYHSKVLRLLLSLVSCDSRHHEGIICTCSTDHNWCCIFMAMWCIQPLYCASENTWHAQEYNVV